MMEPKQKSNNSQCEEHQLPYTDLCLTYNCPRRWLCRVCKTNHFESHLRNLLPLADVYSEGLLDHIDNVISQKEEILNEKIQEKSELLQKVNTTFIELETEIIRVLNQTKSEMLSAIERLHQQLKMHYNEVYFQEIKEFLKRLGQSLQSKEMSESTIELENFSSMYSKTISSIDYGIHVASRFEDESLNFQDIVENIKSSCHNLLSRTFVETSKEEMRNFFGQEKIKVAPQTILCMEHCTNSGLFITGGADGLLTLWDQDTFSYVSHIQTHEDAILSMVYLPAINTLVTSSKDNSLGILIFKDKGTPVPFNAKAGKPTTQLLAVSGGNRLATISEKGTKVRIWELSQQKLTTAESIDVTQTLISSKMFYIPNDELLGITYGDYIKLYSCKENVQKHYLEAFAIIISVCFVEDTGTIHAIVAQRNSDRYNEIIWAKEKNEYKVISNEKIDKTELYGEPIEVISNSNMLFIIFSQGFAMKKAKRVGTSIKFVEVLSQGCELRNLKPAFLTKNASKIMIAGEMKKLKVYNFS